MKRVWRGLTTLWGWCGRVLDATAVPVAWTGCGLNIGREVWWLAAIWFAAAVVQTRWHTQRVKGE